MQNACLSAQTLQIVYKSEISAAERFKVQILILFSSVLSFFPVWRVGVNLNFFPSSQTVFPVSAHYSGLLKSNFLEP